MRNTFLKLKLATVVLVSVAALALKASAADPTIITLTNVPTVTSLTATNGNTNFSSQAINPNGKELVFWIKTVGTNATTTGTVTYSLFGAPDLTNYQSTALSTLAVTLNGTNPVVSRFFLAATNFTGITSLKFGAITNASTNYNTPVWIKVARPN